jgi:UDP-2,4-diacetamido-2,4,6-trideoxy-beta-L-altropyranose hydrolase
VTGPLLVRADATSAIGTGHVMRCLALATAWTRATGAAARLATVAPAPALAGRLGRAGVAVDELATSPSRDGQLANAGTPADADATAALASRLGAAWVVLDGYGFDRAYQQRVAAAGVPVLVVDDHGHLDGYRADLLLNQNFGAAGDRYVPSVAAERLLLGPRYALVRDEFAGVAPAPAPGATVRRVLVTLGGSDPDNATALVVEALGLAALPGIAVTVVAGPANRHVRVLERDVRALAGAELVVDADDLPRRMAAADLAIAAAGGTARELALLGVPSLLLTLAANQRPAAEAMGQQGIAVDLGWSHEATAPAIAAQISALAADRAARAAMATAARAAVDGRGADRVVEAMGRAA